MLNVDLVNNSSSRRNNFEVVECALAPAKELVTLAIALVLKLNVALKRILGAKEVCDDGVVDHELCRSEWVDFGGVSTKFGNGFAHGSEVNDAGNPGEVLHDHARGGELNLSVWLRTGNPGAE